MNGKLWHIWILLLVIVHQLVSYLWYSPHLFAFHWIDASGFRLSRVPSSGTLEYYLPFGLSILHSVALCYAMTLLYVRMAVKTALAGTGWALTLWAVFVFAGTAVHQQFAQQPWLLTLIDGGRDLLLFVLTGAVLGALRQWASAHE